MRKRLLLFTAMMLCSVAMWAQTFTVDGIKYNVTSTTDLTVEVTSGGDYSGDIVIPETVEYNELEYSVTRIGNHAYQDCSGLSSIKIPNSVTSIGRYSFSNCSGLTSITIGNSVTSIGGGAFSGCNCLTSITIPNSVSNLGVGAFEYCADLTSIVVESGNPVYDSRENCNAVIETISNTLHTGCKSTAIPNSVTSIGDWAFLYCGGLASIIIPNSVTSIGEDAFYGCSGLTSITIPNSVTCIGQEAFSGCSSLTSITIPNSVTSIGNFAFASCSGLNSIVVESGNTVYDSRENCNAIIETSSNTLHTGCKNTIIPNSVTSIGNYAFLYCSGLTSITIPNSVTSIGEDAFHGCSGLTSINISNSVTSIGSGAFFGCSGLYSITIPNSVTSISSYAFQECSGLTSVTIGNSVTSIGDWAFSYCSGLTSINIPNSVTSIGNYAFLDCSGLTSITIPNSVMSIGGCAFYRCDGLSSVIVEWDVPVANGSNIFLFNESSNATIYVPKGCKEAYQAADYWKDFKEIVEISKGDLNGDDEYNISDIIQIIDMMTGNGDDDYVATYMADVNGDGEVDIADIIAIINLMIEQVNSSAPELAMAPMEDAQDTSDHIAASISGNELSVELENSNPYAGFQMLVTVPAGLQLTDAALDAARVDKHNVMLRQVAEGQYLVIGYSLSNNVLKGNTGKLLTLTTEGEQNGDININNVLFATADAEKYLLNGICLSGSATDIEGIDDFLSSEDVIYDLNGRRLTAVPKNGPYIKNGKKYIQK